MKRITIFTLTVLLAAACATGSGPEPASQRAFDLEDALQLAQPQIATLSPDGLWITYVVGDTLWVAEREGDGRYAAAGGMLGQARFMTPFQAWSPDGSLFLFRVDGPENHVGTPMLLDASEGTVRPLLRSDDNLRLRTFLHWFADAPAWAPDGRSVVFPAVDSSDDSSQQLQLVEVDVASSEWRIIARHTGNSTGGVVTSAWSPDGRWLAYGTGGFVGTSGRLMLRSPDGTGGNEIVVRDGDAPMYRAMSWSPDGRRLTVLRHNATRLLFDVAPDGTTTLVSESVPVGAGWTIDGSLLGTIARGMSTAVALWSGEDGPAVPVLSGERSYRFLGSAYVNGATEILYSAESGIEPRDLWTARIEPGARSPVQVVRLTRVNPWIDSVRLARAEIVRWTGADGDELEAQLFLPPTGVGTAPYPLVVVPYGGFTNTFPQSEYFLEAGIQLLAGAGWAIVRPNTRASIQLSTHHYGQAELEDTAHLIDALAARSLADPARVATIGHSHGGTMVYYYVSHSDAFCAGIAVNGAADWVTQARLQSMAGLPGAMSGMPDEHPEEYAVASPLLNAASVSAPVLAVSGALDTQIVPQNASSMVDALHSLGKPAELLHFEDEGHLIDTFTNQRLFWTRATEFLDRHCG